MKKIIYGMNIILILLIAILFHGTELKTNKLTTNINIKQFSSSLFKEFGYIPEIIETQEEIVEEESNEVIVSKDEVAKKEVVKEEIITESKKEVVEDSTPTASIPTTDVLETMIGTMSGYGPDCYGCSGYTSSGRYVGNGNITYYDNNYGALRILAGDYSLKFGTIVRVKNSKIGTFTGIVLDRGGMIGIGKTHLFDLLYSSQSEALKDEVSYNVTFEILRYGY